MLDSFEGAVVHGPDLAKEFQALEIDVSDRCTTAAQRKLHAAIEANRQILVVVQIGPRVDELYGAVLMLGIAGQIDRHPAMTDTPAERANAAIDVEFRVDRQAMFVTPEPQHRPGYELGQLLGRLRIPIVVPGKVLMMAEKDDPARIVLAKSHRGAEPLDL